MNWVVGWLVGQAAAHYQSSCLPRHPQTATGQGSEKVGSKKIKVLETAKRALNDSKIAPRRIRELAIAEGLPARSQSARGQCEQIMASLS